MEKQYKHLTMTERELIAKMKYEGKDAGGLPALLVETKAQYQGNSKGTLPQNTNVILRAVHNIALMNEGKQQADALRLKDDKVRRYVHEKLALGWSPELIAGRLLNGTSGIFYQL